MNSASSRNRALSSLTGPDPQQQPLLHAIMLLLSPLCSCRGGPVAWCTRIKPTVHWKTTKVQFDCCSRWVMTELSKAVDVFGFWASLCGSKSNRASKCVHCSSPPAVLLSLGCQDAQRSAESHRATCWYRESCCCAPWFCLSNKVSSHERAFYAPRTDHQHTGELTASDHTARMKAWFVRFKWEFPPRRRVKLIIEIYQRATKCSAWTQPRGLNLTIKTAFALRDQYHLTFPGSDEGFMFPPLLTRGRCEQMSPRNHSSR